MSREQVSTIPPTVDLIRADISDGSHLLFDTVVETIKKQSQASEDLFALAGTDLVQVDLGVGTDTTYRLQLSKSDAKEGSSRHLDIWAVNEEGWPTSDMYTMYNFYSGGGPKSLICGSSRGSMEGGDLDIQPSQLAGYLDNALNRVNEYNWKLVIGRENVPEGVL